MKRTFARILYFASLMIGLLMALIFVSTDHNKLAFIPLIATVGGMILSFYLLRCPYCGRWPTKRSFFSNLCTHCGKEM